MSREYSTAAEGYVAGRASAAVELVQTRESLQCALDREKQLLTDLFATRMRYERQMWVSMVFGGGCACLILVCIALWAQLCPPSF